ncbi:helix-turn-helix domain-containing protein [Agreia pratensis]|uniref:IclR family transcriptional regulator n=1 Tax=Agreia pratensis TaxID=150121 RepID=UPI00188AF4E0|nr:helix-turn-helix domain-containing protein [Agreia pratensis]MBF4633273.1 helix-turn-helix domain-containing protein [Agreia pratensis]
MAASSASSTSASAPPVETEYAAPALDKGLDILELLSATNGALSQAQIASGVGRSVSQIFRVLSTLERRGYVHRDHQSGLYILSLRLFDLAHRHDPLRGLLQASAGPMRALANAAEQSCSLSVEEAGLSRVVAQVESPGDFGFRVRVGALFSLDDSATGEVLRAFRSSDPDTLEPALRSVREAGHVERGDDLHAGVIDIVFPVLRADGTAVAALTVPYVATRASVLGTDAVLRLARHAASQISGSVFPAPTP